MKIYPLILSFVFCLFLINFVSATYVANQVTFVSPVASATVSGTYVLNVTNTTFPLLKNCTIYAKSALTANSSWTSLATLTNTTENSLSVNGTFVSSVLEDSNDYIFNATCRNQSNDVTDRLITGVIISNTNPDAPTSLVPTTDSQIISSQTTTFSGVVTDAKTTSCTYKIAIGGLSSDIGGYTSGSGTYSGSNCSFTKTFSSESDNGNYFWEICASDEVGSTCASSTYSVNIQGVGGGVIEETITEKVKSKLPIILVGIAGLVLLIVLLRKH